MKITNLASATLRAHWDGQVPVNVVAVARGLRLEVIADAELSARGDGLSAVLEHGASGQLTLRYNSKDAHVRQRFAIAHAIGHFVLGHRGVREDPPGHFSARVLNPEERACNRFATELLMPAPSVKHVIMKEELTDIQALAERFAVSEVAMAYRLEQLGWIPRSALTAYA